MSRRRGGQRPLLILCLSMIVGVTAVAVSHSGRPADAAAVVEVVVDRGGAIGEFSMAIGHTHTQRSLEASGDPAAVAAGRQLLGEAVDFQNQHLYGWGTLNPNPSPGVYDWQSLDRRVQLMRDTGAVPVITLCCAPDWMTELGTETSTYPNKPPTARHYDDFADLARRTAERYPDVRHYVIWNEMKGFWNPGAAQWDYVSYTQMYNAVYDALKEVDPAIQVGGPYLVIESTGSEFGGWSTAPPVTRRNRVLLEYWVRHGRGADFVAIDRKVKDYHDTREYSPAETMALTATSTPSPARSTTSPVCRCGTSNSTWSASGAARCTSRRPASHRCSTTNSTAVPSPRSGGSRNRRFPVARCKRTCSRRRGRSAVARPCRTTGCTGSSTSRSRRARRGTPSPRPTRWCSGSRRRR